MIGMLLPVVVPTYAHAVLNIFSCDPTQPGNTTNCTSNCKLLTNITCDGNNPNQTYGITLTNGSTLDMNGFSITCLAGTVCTTAVRMTGGICTVKNSSTSQESSINGAFHFSDQVDAAVDCSATKGKVLGIHFNIGAMAAVEGCGRVENNVMTFVPAEASPPPFIQSPIAAIYSNAINGTTADNNYIDGWPIGIYSIGSSVSDSNIINIKPLADPFATTDGMLVVDAPQITNTVFFGNATDALIHPMTYPYQTTVTASANYCDPAQSSCGACQSAGYCAVPRAPFVMP